MIYLFLNFWYLKQIQRKTNITSTYKFNVPTYDTIIGNCVSLTGLKIATKATIIAINNKFYNNGFKNKETHDSL